MKQLFLTLLIAAIFVSGNAQNFIVTKTGILTNDERVFQMPERTSAKATTDAYTASFTFPSVKIIEKSRKSETYQFLKIQGTGQTTQAGAPALPSFYDQVLAPKKLTSPNNHKQNHLHRAKWFYAAPCTATGQRHLRCSTARMGNG
jgi:hypothetical protein